MLERGGHLRDDFEGVCVKRPLSIGTEAGGSWAAQKKTLHPPLCGRKWHFKKALLIKGTFYPDSSQDCHHGF